MNWDPMIFGVFFLVIVTGAPIAIALLSTTLLLIVFTTNIDVCVLVQQMYSSIDTSLLLAVIFFILAGNIMTAGNISERLIRIGNKMLGNVPGGLAISSVLACMFFAAISGSSPATIVAVGSIMIPALLKAGYGKRFSIGLLTSAGSMGILIPPSIPMIIYAMVMSESVTKQFMAGFLPGLLLGGCFIGYTIFSSFRKGWVGSDSMQWSEVRKAVKDGIWGLSLPFLILGGIYGGIFTPTEASAVAVVIALIIELFIHKSLTILELRPILVQSALIAASILFIISAAGTMSWYLGVEQIPTKAAEWIGGIITQKWVFLILVNLFLLVLGCFMDLVSAMFILGPIFLPMLKKFGIDPIHFGIIMIVNIEIGFLTPPFGINLFVSCSILKESFAEVLMSVMPFFLLMIGFLILITYVPWISTLLPDMFMRLQ
jgi:C4-dicarboxylate transporter DctM subunit